MEKTEVIVSPNGKKHNVRILDIEDMGEVATIMKNEETIPLKGYDSFNVCETRAYLIQGGKIFLNYGGGGMIFDNENSYQAYLISSSSFYDRKFTATELPQTVVFRIPQKKRIIVCSYISEGEAKLHTNHCPPLDYPPKLDLPKQREGDLSYQLPKGRVLFYDGSYNRFTLFQSKNDFFDLLAFNKWWAVTWKTASGFFEPQLWDINHYGDKFETKIPILLKLLPTVIPCPKEILNFQSDGLLRLEKYLYQNKFSHRYREVVFLPLLAYIGEMLRINEEGSWVIKYDKYADHYLPDIILDGKELRLFDSIFRLLDPESSWRPLHAVYYARGEKR